MVIGIETDVTVYECQLLGDHLGLPDVGVLEVGGKVLPSGVIQKHVWPLLQPVPVVVLVDEFGEDEDVVDHRLRKHVAKASAGVI